MWAKVGGGAGFGEGSIWRDVTASRSLNTVYFNGTGKTMAINIAGFSGSGLNIYTGPTNPPTTLSALMPFGGSITFGNNAAFVPKDFYYRVTNAGGLWCWGEFY